MLNVVLFTVLLGCRDDKIAEEDTQEWWESDNNTTADEDSEEKEETSGDEEEKPVGDYEDCPEDFDPQAPCEGSWETTICSYEGVIWWCQDGVWLNEDDK